MTIRWIWRKGHSRTCSSGKVTHVRASWACLEVGDGEQKRRYRQACPSCSVLIVSIRMPNGGWAHYYAEKGLTRVKHPCLHLGEGMSRARDKLTLELFS